MNEAEQRDTRKAAYTAAAGEVLTPETLVREHAAAVLGLCITYTKNFHDGEDIMQDVFLRAFTKIDTLRDQTRARQWLLKIARRMCIDHHRKRRSGQPIDEAHPSVPQGDRSEGARTESGDEFAARMRAAVSSLPNGYREAITLYYLDGRNCAGVARSLGISETAVRSRLVRARLMLHELLVEDNS